MPKVSSSSIIEDYGQTVAQKLCIKLIQQGPMPKHVGVIMDGNRRFAKKNNLSSATEGHKVGALKFSEVANMFLDLGVEQGTVYFLSQDNLKRPPAEVSGLLDLTRKKMERILQEWNELQEFGLRVNVIGNWREIPSDKVKALFAKACKISKGNKKLTLNLAFAYSAHYQICEGISHLVTGLVDESLRLEDLSEDLLQNSLCLSGEYHPVDILIRTGGDARLSDFLLWQSGSAYLEFIPVTWPELGMWDLLRTILRYQRHVIFEAKITVNVWEIGNTKMCDEQKQRQHSFLRKLQNNKWKYIEKFL